MTIPDSVLHRIATSTSWREVLVFMVGLVAARCVYMIFFHPLCHVPGPLIAKCSYLWLYYHSFVGDQSSVIQEMHKKYRPVLRVGPNDIESQRARLFGLSTWKMADSRSRASTKKFDIDGHASIFSTLSLAARGPRAKAVLPLFSATAIREATSIIITSAEAKIERMKEEAQMGTPVNVLNLTRSYALDAVSAYVF